MHTHFVTAIPIDEDRLARDLRSSSTLPWSEAYSDYVFGGAWKSCVLWAPGGADGDGDGVVTHYAGDRPSTFTPSGRRLGYLRELIDAVADPARLNFVRLAKVSNSVIIPHRDLLELSHLPDTERNAHRLHIPLVTNDECFFSEGNTVFRMRQGELWFLNAAEIHSVAVLSDQERVHLMFDFVDRPSPHPLITVPGARSDVGIPTDSLVRRPCLTDADRRELDQLATVLSMDTFGEIFSIVIKKHFRHDGGEDFVWDTMIAMATACDDARVRRHASELRSHFTLERSA